MERHYPKFEQRQSRDQTYRDMARTQGREAIVIAYNSFKNTATVAMSQPKTDELGDIHRDVPCPTTNGIIGVAPDPGRACWVTFKDENERRPVITHFYNNLYEKYDYETATNAQSMTPRFYSSI